MMVLRLRGKVYIMDVLVLQLKRHNYDKTHGISEVQFLL